MASSFSGSINNSSNVDITSLQPVQVTTFCVLVVLGSFKDEMEVEHSKPSIFLPFFDQKSLMVLVSNFVIVCFPFIERSVNFEISFWCVQFPPKNERKQVS